MPQKTQPKEGRKSFLNCEIDPALRRKAKSIAVSQDKDLKDFVSEAIQHAIEQATPASHEAISS